MLVSVHSFHEMLLVKRLFKGLFGVCISFEGVFTLFLLFSLKSLMPCGLRLPTCNLFAHDDDRWCSLP